MNVIPDLPFKAIYRILVGPMQKEDLSVCGTSTVILRNCDTKGLENISVGHDCLIDVKPILWTAKERTRI